MEQWLGFIGGVLAAIATGVVTFVTTKQKLREEQKLAIENALREQQAAHNRALQELQLEYDRTLRDHRLEHYQRLYHVSRCIPREWRTDEQPTRRNLLKFRELFHNWYFGEHAGGLFLTSRARDRYFRLQNELELLARSPAGGDIESLSPEESKTLRELASDLRHQLVEDVGTAEPPRLQWTRVAPAPPPPSESQPPVRKRQSH